MEDTVQYESWGPAVHSIKVKTLKSKKADRQAGREKEWAAGDESIPVFERFCAATAPEVELELV